MITLQSKQRSWRQMLPVVILLLSRAAISFADLPQQGLFSDSAWKRHTIDASSRGADGARLADVNGDGLLDITTGWEEGGVIRVYLNPGPKKVHAEWPAVTVGKVKSPEDAVFVDLDGDGAIDVVSSCEGRNRTMFVHWAPADRTKYLASGAWRTDKITTSSGKQSWMFALPMQIDGTHGIDLIVASKSKGAAVGWLQAPPNARDMAAWKYHKLYQAGWIMSLLPIDMDQDGDTDVVVSDRKGKTRGVLWLENPGAKSALRGESWKQHRVGGANREVMFLDVADLNGDHKPEILVAVKPAEVLWFQRDGEEWRSHSIKLPAKTIGTAKSVRAADINLDGRIDLVFSCESASPPKSGLIWLSYKKSVEDVDWIAHDISGPRGVKFDLLQLLDVDRDGDLDVICCEERHNLGVFWYENPSK